jgi:hypothetical protein
MVDRTAAVRFRVLSKRTNSNICGDEGDGNCVVLQFLRVVGMPSGIELKLREGTSKLLHSEHSIVGC